MNKTALVLTMLIATCFLAAPASPSGKVVVIGTHAAGNAIPWWGGAYNSCRFQCLWFQSDINYAGYIDEIEFEKSSSASGTFNNVRVWLCHTTKTQLEANFDNNYTGKTPVQVLNTASLNLTGSGYFDIGITPNTFNYNNSDNLLMEVRWDGDSGSTCSCYRSSQPYSRVGAWNHNASSGTVWNNGQCIRLHIGTMTGVAPTSLGRVKALFQ